MYKRRNYGRRNYRSRRTYRRNGRISGVRTPQSLMGRIGAGITRYGPTALKIAGTALNGVRMLRSILNSELKTYDYGRTKIISDPVTRQNVGFPVSMNDSKVFTTATSTHVFDYLTGITVGNGMNQRAGNTVKLKSLRLRMRLTSPYFSTGVPCGEVRIIMFLDKASNGIAPSLNDVYSSADSGMDLDTNTDSLLIPRNVVKSKRFEILYDRVVTINSDNLSFQSFFNIVDIYKRFSNLHLDYIGQAATQDPTQAMTGIFLAVVTANTISGKAGPQCTYTSRLRFYDN